MRWIDARGVESDRDLVQGSALGSVFGRFCHEAIGLSPVATEEFPKVYVAHSGEINFVAVVPQVSRLRLAPSMRSHEPDDPRGVGKDVPNPG